MASRTVDLEVGQNKDIESEDWSGVVTQKRIIYGELLKKVSDAQLAMKDEPLVGASLMFDVVQEGYPKVNLKFGKHKFTSIDQIYDSEEGQSFVNKHLVSALIKPVKLAKN